MMAALVLAVRTVGNGGGMAAAWRWHGGGMADAVFVWRCILNSVILMFGFILVSFGPSIFNFLTELAFFVIWAIYNAVCHFSVFSCAGFFYMQSL
jgi:hypothetical protein